MMSNKRIKNNTCLLCFVVLQLVGSTVFAQNIEQIYEHMPTIFHSVLSEQKRIELIEYAKAGESDSIQNVFGNWSRLIELDMEHDYICLHPTEDFELQLMLFRNENQADTVFVIGLIETVCAPVCSSVIHFYDHHWRELPLQSPVFTANDFLKIVTNAIDTIDYEKMQEQLFPVFVRAQFDKDTRSIIFSNETIWILSDEDREKYATYLKTVNWSIPY